ncbi:hypothetical protein HPP92_011457 [Vanilla planifolia]|uniref:Uncharacterized protein n=1 Tax=Vanilla planifolia TaxID=51239 RepID=A0A835R487_VANPL|nr:hypothetical protein HPP92_011457 [Vanilla planifolia]
MEETNKVNMLQYLMKNLIIKYHQVKNSMTEDMYPKYQQTILIPHHKTTLDTLYHSKNNNGETVATNLYYLTSILIQKPTSSNLKDDGTFSSKRNEAFLRYELLTDLQKQLTSILSQQNGNSNVAKGCMPSLHNPKQEHHTPLHSSDIAKRMKLAEKWSTVSTRHNPMDSPDQSLACYGLPHMRCRDGVIAKVQEKKFACTTSMIRCRRSGTKCLAQNV